MLLHKIQQFVMNLFVVSFKASLDTFPLAFSKALTRNLYHINTGKMHLIDISELSSSLWMSKIILEAVRSYCHVLHSQTMKEMKNSSCNKINYQQQLSGWAQTLQLHHDMVLVVP